MWAAGAGLTQLAMTRGARAARATTSAATVLGVASAGLAVGAVLRFRSRGTTVDPMDVDRAQALVTDGVNAWTRNPMYVGLAGMLAAHAVHRRSPAGLLPVLGFVLAIDRWQIPAEEAALERAFGGEYDAYRRAIPRWVLR
ncbi:hypothetical protein A605_05230 [Corynebacterium halotolerans YIM 70093 = DSM 44683]|uniref:Isoprenylcysteine carboxylmethyltransferase family protein n=1 Tax=Corynebacterium halotolerans YIM 70093 = DSM 44683 TaxID=1121362 RepID=M1NRC5_9CORY|nr:hypothetical protein A605_05230 [Corynebacterium halotolerans YIM 70093 = DSM 44683]